MRLANGASLRIIGTTEVDELGLAISCLYEARAPNLRNSQQIKSAQKASKTKPSHLPEQRIEKKDEM
jgi:hypothetical protein